MTQPTYCPSPQFQRAQIQPVAFPLSLPLLKGNCTCAECPSNPAMQLHREGIAMLAEIQNRPVLLRLSHQQQVNELARYLKGLPK